MKTSLRAVTLVAIDPGYGRRSGGCAVAVFAGVALVRATFERPETVRAETLRCGAREVVWEKPQCDARSRVIAPTLIELTAAGATLAGMFAGACGCACVAVTPSTWKGSVPKAISHGRLWAVLDDHERAILGGADTLAIIESAKRQGGASRWPAGKTFYPATWNTHNLLDAVALGATRMGRL